MKVLSLKALSCALLTTTLFLSTNLTFAATTVTKEIIKVQKIIHLNKSTIDDLVTLKGIGHKKAQAILTYREQVGLFKSIDDLTKVKGIGDKVLMDIQGRLKI